MRELVKGEIEKGRGEREREKGGGRVASRCTDMCMTCFVY